MVLSILSAIGTVAVLAWGIRVAVKSPNYEYNTPNWEECGCFDEYDEFSNTTSVICVDCVEERTGGRCGGVSLRCTH